MARKTFLWMLFVVAALMLLAHYFGAPRVDYAITVNGEQVHGLQGIALAAGGLLVAGLAVVGALTLIALFFFGASMVLMGMITVLFLALLFAFSPMLASVAGVTIAVALIVRKRKDASRKKPDSPADIGQGPEQ